MEVDLQSLFGLHITWCAQLYSLAETPHPPPPNSNRRALLVSKDRRHLFVTPCFFIYLFTISLWGYYLSMLIISCGCMLQCILQEMFIQVAPFSTSDFPNQTKKPRVTVLWNYGNGCGIQHKCTENHRATSTTHESRHLKVYKIENFVGSDFEFSVISLLVMLKY